MKITKRELHRLLGEAKKKPKEGAMSVSRNDIRRLVNEALDEMSMMGGAGGMRRRPRGMCLFVTYGGGVYYFVAPCGTPEDDAVTSGTDVTSELDPEGMGMADALSLYEWLQSHDEITHVHDEESVGGTVPKQMYMEQVRAVGEEEGLFAPEGEINEGAFPEELEGIYGEEPPDFGKRGSRDDSFMDYDPEEIPDMDDQYDPEYYEGLEDEEDDSWMDYETGDDDVPYGAADVALRMGRGYRTDEAAAPVNEARWAKLAGILKG